MTILVYTTAVRTATARWRDTYTNASADTTTRRPSSEEYLRMQKTQLARKHATGIVILMNRCMEKLTGSRQESSNTLLQWYQSTGCSNRPYGKAVQRKVTRKVWGEMHVLMKMIPNDRRSAARGEYVGATLFLHSISRNCGAIMFSESEHGRVRNIL